MIIITPRKLSILAALLAVALGLYFGIGGLRTWEPGNRATFWVLTVTAAAALGYAWLTYQILRAEHVPILTAVFRGGQTVVRNNGKGAALNASVANAKGGFLWTIGDLPPSEERSITQNLGWSIAEAR
jgi:hypothetical protein